ncbi:MAG TPA: tetratricopeptide repeat protein [Roseateles sp.]|uniref:tetratricopeptide repeat protein n=1 Tax=Roseateles sp. TaxID=1971397 RepID=UPI002EDB7FAE
MADLAGLLDRAIAQLRQEHLPEAEALLEQALRLAPGQPDAQHFLGVLRHAQGRSAEGLALIEQAIQAMPGEPGPWNNLGNVLVECQQLDAAERAYRRSAELAQGGAVGPAGADALNNLGTVQRKRGQWVEAEASCRAALAVQPELAGGWYNLSLALMGQGRIHDALLANSRAITLSPRHLTARDQFIRALLLQGEREQAATLYREWLAEEPDNPVVQHQLAACLGQAAPQRASDAYVEQVFDSFAKSFDAKLQSLHYRAPELVARALRAAAGEPRASLDIVDAGCGTGLCGPLLRPFARRLAGCDLSVGMLRQARPRGVYDMLHKAELVYYLDTQPAAFDAIVSADTLCYFGPLDAVFTAARRALRPGGWLVFTVESTAGPLPHALQPNGRYVHGQDYLHQALADAGFGAPTISPEVLRLEAGLPVNGWLVSATAAAAGR